MSTGLAANTSHGLYPDKLGHLQSVSAYLRGARMKASLSFDRGESTMFRLPTGDTRCRRTLFIHGYQDIVHPWI